MPAPMLPIAVFNSIVAEAMLGGIDALRRTSQSVPAHQTRTHPAVSSVAHRAHCDRILLSFLMTEVRSMTAPAAAAKTAITLVGFAMSSFMADR
jgi:hypothetical protein